MSARAAVYLAGAGVRSNRPNLLTALRGGQPPASGLLAAELPAAANAIIPEAPAAAVLPADLQQRVLGLAMLKGNMPTISEIQRELRVGVPEVLRLQDYARCGAVERPATLVNSPTPMLEHGLAAADNVAGINDPTGLIDPTPTAASGRPATTPDEIHAPGYPTSGIAQVTASVVSAGTPGSIGGPMGASAATGLTSRRYYDRDAAAR